MFLRVVDRLLLFANPPQLCSLSPLISYAKHFILGNFRSEDEKYRQRESLDRSAISSSNWTSRFHHFVHAVFLLTKEGSARRKCFLSLFGI
jgi:hypothetical protein